MIYLGYSDAEKRAVIAAYQAQYSVQRTLVISADLFPLAIPDADAVPYSQVIMYVTFYRLLQEITPNTLIVLNECLRTQNRYDLTYNCIRNYLNLTTHQLIFQQLPQIDTAEDFMILFDFDTHSRWKRRPFDPYLIKQETQVTAHPLPLAFDQVDVPTSAQTRAKYVQERERLFRTLGHRDPHTLPRNLALLGGADKLAYIDACNLPLFASGDHYVARNKRLKRGCIITYEQVTPDTRYTLIEFPHRFLDYCDFVQRTDQAQSQVLVADLPVDHWYFQRYHEWSQRIHETYANLSS